LSQNMKGHRILFVENSPQACDGIRTVFEKAGSGIVTEFTPTPEAAIEILKRETADAVFVNQLQTNMDACKFLHALTAIDRQVPVIIRSLHGDEEAVLRALKDGAHDVLTVDQDSFGDYPSAALRAIARFEFRRESSEQIWSIIRSQKQWMSIIDAITDFIFVLDNNQTIVTVNNSFATEIGSHPRDLIGRQIRDVFDLHFPSESHLQEVLQHGAPRTYEIKISEEIYQISIFPMQESSRTLSIHVMKNITQLRKLKDKLFHSEKLASIGLLVSGVAHEINNPLTGVIAYSELLDMKMTDEGVKADLKKILNCAERCKKIVENLMMFSRQRTPSKSIESVNEIIDRAIDLRSYWLRSRNIELERDYDPFSSVLVDGQQIQQVILNLLLNAEQAIVDSGQSHGRIRFSTRCDRDTHRVSISVIDNGPGIPKAIASKIFDPFFTTKSVGVGTGLGLSLSHGIIIEHGGTIEFENIEDGGVAFTIQLPTGAGMAVAMPPYRESERVK
jgi:PAS domain S-box-containing protein